jgi:hypothetical protein
MSDKPTIRDRFPDAMPFLDDMKAHFGDGIKIVHIKNKVTGDEMETRDNIEPPYSLNAAQFIKLGQVENACDVEDRRRSESEVRRGRK